MNARWLFVSLCALAFSVLAGPNGLTLVIVGGAATGAAAAMLWERAGTGREGSGAAPERGDTDPPVSNR